MKLNLLDLIIDSAIAFSLAFNLISIFRLFFLGQSWSFSMIITLIIVELMTGYAFTERMIQRWRNARLLKSDLVVDAIAALSEHPGYTTEGATGLVLSLCRNIPRESHESILRDIASRSGASMAEQVTSLQGKSFVGDITCQNNARSPFIRCAIAPELNSCEGCKDYSNAISEGKDII